MMTKRPSTPANPPPPKRPTTSHARIEESPSSDDFQLAIPILDGLCEDIRFKINKNGVTEENFHYKSVYWKIHDTYEKLGRVDNFLDEKTFLANIEHERHDFFVVLQRGAAEDASLAEKKAIVSHSTCFSCRVNRS